MELSRKAVFLLRHRISLGLVLASVAAFSIPPCRAQSPSAAARPIDAAVSRNIEVTLRAKLQIPPDYVIHIGPRTPSDTPGFDDLKVDFDLPGDPAHSQSLTFLISDDNKTLERVARWDIGADTANLVPYSGRPIRGNPQAKVVLVNFDDLECPFCAKLHSELFPDTLDHYKGLIKIVYRDMPLEELHPWAMHAAVNANCLVVQSGAAYWSFVDYAHTHGEDITGPDRDVKKSEAMLDKLTLAQGEKDKLDMTKLGACVAKQDESVVRNEMKLADSLNIDQTPTLYVNGEMVQGALPEDVLWKVIDRALIAEGVTPPPNPYNQPAKPAVAAEGGTAASR